MDIWILPNPKSPILYLNIDIFKFNKFKIFNSNYFHLNYIYLFRANY